MEKERFAGKIRELLICVSKCQPIEVLGEPGTVEIEAIAPGESLGEGDLIMS